MGVGEQASVSQSGQSQVSMGSLRNAIGCRRQPVSGELSQSQVSMGSLRNAIGSVEEVASSQSQVSMGSLRKTMEWVEASGADVETSLAPMWRWAETNTHGSACASLYEKLVRSKPRLSASRS